MHERSEGGRRFRGPKRFNGPRRTGGPGGSSRGGDTRGFPGVAGNKRAMFLSRSKETVMEALRSRDMVLGAVTKTIEDTDKIINLFAERLEHWYGIYFPELRFEDKVKFAEAVLVIDRKALDKTGLEAIFGAAKADEIIAAAGRTLGADLPASDLEQCQRLAKEIVSLGVMRKDYEKYQHDLAMELCPSMSQLAGADVAAKMISHVGSLKRLAVLPASTLQVIGAEKSLFKHLRNRNIPPPKHGILFQNAKISSSPKSVRGKIARTLANKLATATKADAFTKNNLGSLLKKQFEDRFNEIMAEYERKKKSMPPVSNAPLDRSAREQDRPPRDQERTQRRDERPQRHQDRNRR